MQKQCPKCNKVTEIPGLNLDVTYFGCPNCNTLSSFAAHPEGRIVKTFSGPHAEPDIPVGLKGTLNGVEYTVTGVVVKQVQDQYYWREYILTAAESEQLYLSETDGHWILLKRIDDKYDPRGYWQEYEYEGMTMKLYETEDPVTYFARGFFDYNVMPDRQKMSEYINPPYIYSAEELDNEQTVYFGEHISPRAVKKAFGLPGLPAKVGVGIVQPFLLNLRQTGIIFCAVSILILISHFVIYSNRQRTVVLDQVLSLTEYTGKEYVSAPFTLEGGSAPLEVQLSTDVDNSWASVEVGLVNEVTSEGQYATKDIEYYHGYEGGENWSEGSTSERFAICGVSAGKYHLVITPQKAPDDIQSRLLQVKAEWNRDTTWNVLIPVLIMIIIFVVAYFVSVNFNRKRWADSNYSPYDNSDY